ncbi:MAG: DMT family transporter [Pseudomonadota bacterium]
MASLHRSDGARQGSGAAAPPHPREPARRYGCVGLNASSPGPAHRAGRSATAIAFASIILGAACFGTLPLFARTLSDFALAPAAIAFYRFALTAVVLAPFVFVARRQWRGLLWALGAGAAMGLGWIGFVMALERLSVAQTGVLFMTFPVFAIAFAALVFGERPRAGGLVGAALIVVAALVVAPPHQAIAGGPITILLALAAPAAYGLLITVIANRLSVLPPIAAAGAVSLGSVIILAPIIAMLPAAQLVPAGPGAMAWLLGFAVVTALVPQLLFVIFAPVLGSSKTAMAGSVELPTMFLIGAVAFGEPLRVAHALAILLIAAAIALSAGIVPLGKSAPVRR